MEILGFRNLESEDREEKDIKQKGVAEESPSLSLASLMGNLYAALGIYKIKPTWT